MGWFGGQVGRVFGLTVTSVASTAQFDPRATTARGVARNEERCHAQWWGSDVSDGGVGGDRHALVELVGECQRVDGEPAVGGAADAAGDGVGVDLRAVGLEVLGLDGDAVSDLLNASLELALGLVVLSGLVAPAVLDGQRLLDRAVHDGVEDAVEGTLLADDRDGLTGALDPEVRVVAAEIGFDPGGDAALVEHRLVAEVVLDRVVDEDPPGRLAVDALALVKAVGTGGARIHSHFSFHAVDISVVHPWSGD